MSPIDIVNGNRLKTYGSDALSYDNNGNLTSDGSNTYTWNARGELIGISGAVTASFRYDAFGRRRGKTVNGTERKYLYDGANAMQEINTSGNPTQHFLTGLGIDEVFVRTNGSGGAKRLPLTDALGSTLALAMTDGSFAASYACEPYGAATISGDPVGYPYTYTGREDDGTGLYDYRARYYSPEYGRFISEYPIGFAGGLNSTPTSGGIRFRLWIRWAWLRRITQTRAAEGYSEAVARLMVDQWRQFPGLVELAKRDPEFEQFVLQHIDETLDPADLGKINRLAITACPPGVEVLCQHIAETATKQ